MANTIAKGTLNYIWGVGSQDTDWLYNNEIGNLFWKVHCEER